MIFEELLRLVGREPVFETGFLLAGTQNPAYLRRQLAEWVRAGKLWQLRRGLYAPAPPYQQYPPHPFLVANRLVPGSYVSLEAALAFYELIPEHVAAVTSVTARRPGIWHTPVGSMIYRHVRPEYLFGYERLEVTAGQAAFVAQPEKALLDLAYLRSGGDEQPFLASLRLQNLERLDGDRLAALAAQLGKPKLWRVVEIIGDLITAERKDYQAL
jgi:predicted transcriptional regulator of viral defense system